MSSDTTRKSPQRQRIGKYEVVEHIATGGMGAVYKAIDTQLNRVVALKILSPEMAQNKIMLARFKREAQSAAKLRHENIVTIFEYSEDKDTHYLALEFVDGKDLHDLITRKGKLSVELAREVTLQAARALDHAAAANIVHRDIKPSNFLITEINGKMLVKLTDLGLAREMTNEEHQVTRAGTTVGTVDYMSPEQARDSKSADTRSDLYSLGCTVYHMLAGIAPFAEGSLTERIYKHIEMAPPDIRQFNAKIPAYFVAILNKLLAKNPEERYQTPAELIRDLERQAVESKTLKPEDTPIPVKKKPRPASTAERKVSPPAKPKKKPPSTPEPRRKARRSALPKWWPIAAGGGGVLVVALVIGLIIANSGGGPVDIPTPPDEPPVPPIHVEVKPKEDQPKIDDPKEIVPVVKPEPPPPIFGPEEFAHKWLYRTATRFEPERRQKHWHDIAGPFSIFQPEIAAATIGVLGTPNNGLLHASGVLNGGEAFRATFPAAPADAVVLRVSRMPAPEPNTFRTMAEAFAKLPVDRPAIIEINDNGPLFVQALPELRDARVWIRGATGYRPLIVWLNPDKKSPRFMATTGGKLVLADLDIVVKWPETPLEQPAIFFQVVDGEFQARRCTFSMSGDSPSTLLHMQRSMLTLSGSKPPLRCRLSEIYVRGNNTTAISTHGCPAEMLVDRCLIAGGDRPLFDLMGQDTDIHPAALRLFRTTLVAGTTLLRVQNMKEQTNAPRLQINSWDSLLACNSTRPDSIMVQVANNGVADNLQWQPTNCLYIGWKNLLDAGGKKIPGGAMDAFRKNWFYAEVDADFPQETWPTAKPARLSEAPAALYDPVGSPFAFAATSGPGVIGADFGRLPAAPGRWLERTFEPAVLPPVALIEPDTVPAIPDPGDGKYHGERIDVAQANLGMIVQQRLKENFDKLGPKIVFHLIGAGDCPTTPFRVSGVKELVIYAEQPAGDALRLAPAENSGDQTALIEVEDGNLDLIGVHIRFANDKFALAPHHMIRVRHGSVRLLRCRLNGPTSRCPDSYLGLIAADTTHLNNIAEKIGINESVLVSARKLIDVSGADCQIRIRQSVLVGLDNVVHVDPAGAYLGAMKLQCTFDHSTFAFGKALATFRWSGEGIALGEPFTLHATRSLFVDPFTTQPKLSTLLTSDRYTLTKGLLRWQGDFNGFDYKRWAAYMTVLDEKPCTSLAAWEQFWGPGAEQKPRLIDFPDNKRYVVNSDDPELENLSLPLTIRLMPGEEPPGANLSALGIMRKKGT